MIDIDLITSKYDPKDYTIDYHHGQPVPWIAFDNFLPSDLLAQVQTEFNTIPGHMWSEFTRNNSHMLECNNLKYSPTIRELTMNLHSSEFLEWLERITGLSKLVPDPHLIGAGMMRCYQGHSLKLHTDFNWNEQLHLNRAVSMILYVSEDWKEEWNGSLEFWNFEKTQCLHRVLPKPNRLLIWTYDERTIHGHPTPLTCPTDVSRDGIRFFYFKSNASPASQPHRSLYWFDKNNQPYDIRENK